MAAMSLSSAPQATPAPAVSAASDAREIAAAPAAAPVAEEKVEEEEAFRTNPVRLRAQQIAHVRRLMQILSWNPFFIDNSVMGAGKTHSTSWVAHAMHFSYIVVVCTASNEYIWQGVKKTYGLPIGIVTSYQSLRSVWGSQPKHGMLSRRDVETYDEEKKKKKRETEYSATEAFKNTASGGIFLIVDEFQHVKNDNGQHDALAALIQHIYRSGGPSRVALISGTPFDKRKQVVSMMRMIGIITDRNLTVYHKNEGRLELQGAQQVVDYCSRLDRARTMAVISETPFNSKNAEEVCYQLYNKVMQLYVSSTMPLPNIAATLDTYNGYFNLSPEASRNVNGHIGDLHRATRFDAASGAVDLTDLNMGAVTKASEDIQIDMTEAMIRLAEQVLKTYPNDKVVCVADYNKPIFIMAEALRAYNPVVLNGDVSKTERPKYIQKFQEDSNDSRLLIGNMQVVCEGVSLDDQFGGRPRHVFYFPNYFAIRTSQLEGRFRRADTKSDATMVAVYSKVKKLTSILNSLSRKSIVMKETLQNQAGQGMRFPGEYRQWEEPEPATPIVYVNRPVPSTKWVNPTFAPAIIRQAVYSPAPALPDMNSKYVPQPSDNVYVFAPPTASVQEGPFVLRPRVYEPAVPAAAVYTPQPLPPLPSALVAGIPEAVPRRSRFASSTPAPPPPAAVAGAAVPGRAPSPTRGFHMTNLVLNPTIPVAFPTR